MAWFIDESIVVNHYCKHFGINRKIVDTGEAVVISSNSVRIKLIRKVFYKHEDLETMKEKAYRSA